MSSLHHYNKEEFVKLKRKYDMQVSKEAIEEIKHNIDLVKEIKRLKEDNMLLKTIADNRDSIAVSIGLDYFRIKEENEQLQSIIKEIREYIGLTDEDRDYLGIYDVNGIGILNILDKVKENK